MPDAAQHRLEGRDPEDALALRLNMLCFGAAAAHLPFGGDVDDLRELAGDRLVIDIDPRVIKRQLPLNLQFDGVAVGVADHFIGRGDWAAWAEPVEDTPIFRELVDIRSLVAAGRPMTAGAAYDALLSRLRSGRPARRNHLELDSEERIAAYLKDIAGLIASIEQDGYRRRPVYAGEEGLSRATARSHAGRPVFVELAETEIGAAVGPAGELYRIGAGNHRFAAARLLGIERVPVELRLFHCGWYSALQRKHGGTPLDAIFTGINELRAQNSPPCSETGSRP